MYREGYPDQMNSMSMGYDYRSPPNAYKPPQMESMGPPMHPSMYY